MRILFSGGSGLIGSRLADSFGSLGWTTAFLRRTDLVLPEKDLAGLIEGNDVVINLAGAGIATRWTAANKELIYSSRVHTTRRLTAALLKVKKPPSLFISASASGIFSSSGIHKDSSTAYGEDFLSRVCIDWEEAAMPAGDACRLVITRFGVVLDRHGGALGRLLPVFRLGLGGPVGSGKQPFPWIHIDDLPAIFRFMITRENMKGAFNIVAPEQHTNGSFSKVLASVLKRPSFLRVPEWVLRLFLGEGATVLTQGQSLLPEKLLNEGYPFLFPDLRTALENLNR